MIISIALIAFIAFREIISYKERKNFAELLCAKSLSDYRPDGEFERAEYTTPSKEQLRKQNGDLKNGI